MADESFDWQLGKAPKQSITELLHNPRGPTLELPDVSLDLPALSLTPVPHVPVREPLDINHFEAYLRRYAPLYDAYHADKAAAPPAPRPLRSVPQDYFSPDFSLAANHDVPALHSDAPLADNPHLPALRAQLAAHNATLQHHLKLALDAHTPAITAALRNAAALRAQILATASALRDTRHRAHVLLPAVAAPISAAHTLTRAQTNLRALRTALHAIHLVVSAPADVALLLDAAEYSAAIDAVHAARDRLAHPHLAQLTALAPVRARLAQSVETIDAALRRQFRHALEDANHPVLREVVALVARLGRLSTLHRFFMREIKQALARALNDVATLPQAARAVRTSAASAVVLIDVIHHAADDNHANGEAKHVKQAYLREAHTACEEMLSGVVDRILGAFAVNSRDGSVVITQPDHVTEEACFDEFKAALKCGEEIRHLESLASELEELFSVERKRGALRAKISERQISFLSSFHKAHTDALTQSIHADKWQEVRVPDGALRLLAAVLGNEQTPNNNSSATDTTPTGVEGCVVIDSEAFKTVASGVRYLRSMCAYTLIAEKSPILASEIARRAADYSRLFNSLVGQAILGAAALQWSGLRSITARHLSLASRTIAMAASLAKHANQPLQQALSGAQVNIVLPLMKSAEKDLKDHHGQLLAKILAIMMDRLEAHEAVLKSLPWGKSQEMQRFDMPSAYVVTLAKEATVLHRILWSILPKTEVFDIFQRVCAAYGTHLSEAYGSLDGGKRWIRIRVAKDVAYLHERLLCLDVFKANPDSFKPLGRLYSRFAKDALEEEDKNQRSRYNRQAEKVSANRETHTAEVPLNASQPGTNSAGQPNGLDRNRGETVPMKSDPPPQDGWSRDAPEKPSADTNNVEADGSGKELPEKDLQDTTIHVEPNSAPTELPKSNPSESGKQSMEPVNGRTDHVSGRSTSGSTDASENAANASSATENGHMDASEKLADFNPLLEGSQKTGKENMEGRKGGLADSPNAEMATSSPQTGSITVPEGDLLGLEDGPLGEHDS